eukprot:NODE_2312_length_946_cov_95.160535_g1902_i0.p1 GENE.NODE_2312_length_946_cov_95.160535_g1902_i0~~NODE_2312_length_946_cov_95.160535_g1902_i0.p1  ORF type:complete len:61 (+),score=8.51 NODE_2312_length_946_cov_95.160535_g1902_i0:51-233(+)
MNKADSPNKSGGGENAEGEENIQNFIEVLEEHRKQCETEGKYVDAEMAKNRIAELKQQEF